MSKCKYTCAECVPARWSGWGQRAGGNHSAPRSRLDALGKAVNRLFPRPWLPVVCDLQHLPHALSRSAPNAPWS